MNRACSFLWFFSCLASERPPACQLGTQRFGLLRRKPSWEAAETLIDEFEALLAKLTEHKKEADMGADESDDADDADDADESDDADDAGAS